MAEDLAKKRARANRYVERHREKVYAAQRARYIKDPEHIKAINEKWKARNLERFKATAIKWRAANKARARATTRQWQQLNKAKLNAKAARYRLAHPDRVQAAGRRSKLAHRAKATALENLRRARQLQATPRWANATEMQQVYEAARAMMMLTGIAHHVDHVVPMNSKVVCGLHCEANLQILEGAINIRKGNRRWPDMPE